MNDVRRNVFLNNSNDEGRVLKCHPLYSHPLEHSESLFQYRFFAMVPNIVVMVNFANLRHSRHFRVSSGSPTRLARTLSSRQNDSSQTWNETLIVPRHSVGLHIGHYASLNDGNNPGIGFGISPSQPLIRDMGKGYRC